MQSSPLHTYITYFNRPMTLVFSIHLPASPCIYFQGFIKTYLLFYIVLETAVNMGTNMQPRKWTFISQLLIDCKFGHLSIHSSEGDVYISPVHIYTFKTFLKRFTCKPILKMQCGQSETFHKRFTLKRFWSCESTRFKGKTFYLNAEQKVDLN